MTGYVPYWDEYDLKNTTQEFRDRWDAVAAVLTDFDDSLITESLEKGWTVEHTIDVGKEIIKERDELNRHLEPLFDMDIDFMDDYDDRD